MRIGPYKRLGMDLHTAWGTYPSPYITQPASAVVKPWLPPTIRGRHQYRVQPRALTVMPPDLVTHDGVTRDIANRARASLVPGNPGYGAVEATTATPPDPQKETKLGLYVVLGVVGAVVGYLTFEGRKAPQRNQGRRRRPARRGSGACPGAQAHETLWRKLSASQRAELLRMYGAKNRVPRSAMFDSLGA